MESSRGTGSSLIQRPFNFANAAQDNRELSCVTSSRLMRH